MLSRSCPSFRGLDEDGGSDCAQAAGVGDEQRFRTEWPQHLVMAVVNNEQIGLVLSGFVDNG